MTDLSFPLLLSIFVFLLFPLIGSFIAIRMRMSPLIGYIVGGIILGLIFGSKLPRASITNFSMIGLILLVFTIGLETNFSLIKRFGKFVFVGGLLQIILSTVSIFTLSLVFRFPFIAALFFGCAFALSSTAVVSKIIQDRGESDSLTGGLAIGVLIFQDLAFIPILIVLSSLRAEGNLANIAINVLLSGIKAVLVLGTVYWGGQQIIPYVFNRIARISRELLNLFIIVFICALLLLFSFFGLSSLLAAFIAGILVGQTLEHYHIFSQIRPLRDLLVVVFFVFLGLTLDIGFFIGHLPQIVLFAILVSLIKMAIVLAIYLFFRFHSRTASSLAIYLFQIGEDAFILLYLGFTKRLLSNDSYYFALSVVLITLFCTPILINKKDVTYQFLRRFIKKRLPFLELFISRQIDREAPNLEVLPLRNHVIICGYGRVGRYIGRALTLANIPYVAIDYNFHTVEKAKKEGASIIYGDPTEIDVLDYAQAEHASVLISAVPEKFAQETIVLNAKKLNPHLVILTRVHTDIDQRRMRDLGVQIVVQPEFEASLSIIRRVLLWRGFSKEEIANKIRRIKIEHGMI